MGSTKARRHIHKYHRIPVSFQKVWACALPDCSHYMPPHMENLVHGKNSRCWECDDIFVLDASSMSEDKPICSECTINRIRKQFNLVESERTVE